MAAHTQDKAAEHPASPPPTRQDPESGANLVSQEKDVAIGLVGEHARDIDPEVEARVLRKIDWFLIPPMIVGTRASPANIPS